MLPRRKLTGWLTALLAAACLAPLPAAAEERHHGTAEEAQAMVADAIAYYDEMGEEAALARFTHDPAPRFLDGDLYVFVLSAEGISLAHGAIPSLVGGDLSDLRDVDGKALMREMLAMASAEGAWVDYKWLNPVTGAIEPKSSWVRRHNDRIFGVGVYRP